MGMGSVPWMAGCPAAFWAACWAGVMVAEVTETPEGADVATLAAPTPALSYVSPGYVVMKKDSPWGDGGVRVSSSGSIFEVVSALGGAQKKA